MQKLTDEGSVTVKMTLAVFGETEDALDGASIDILLNDGTRNSGVDPSEFFNAITDTIVFTLTDLVEGDLLSFVIHKNTGLSDTYSGEVSSTDDQEATIETSDDEACLDCPDDKDGDGFFVGGNAAPGFPSDCDDNDPSIFPGASDPLGDGIDQDCSGADGV